MYLLAGSRRLGVAQLGPDFIILDEPTEVPPGPGELVVLVDGNEKRRAVTLPAGIRAYEIRTPIARA